MTALAPVDVEAALVSALASPVSTRVPNPRPASFTRVTRTGGDQRNLVQSDVQVLVECWGPDEASAFGRARSAWAVLWASRGSFLAPGVWVSRAELTEPVNFPDPDTASPRYQFVARLTTGLSEA